MGKRPRQSTAMELFTRMMFTRIITALARQLRDEALSLAQIAALHQVDQRGVLRLSELAEELGLSASATSRLVDGLVQREWLARAEDPADRRNKALTLTAQGAEFIARIDADRVQTVMAAAETLPRAVVAGILAAVREFAGRQA